MKKLILLAILLAAWWYFDGGRRMTEASIRENYQVEMDATDRFDAEWLCAHMADNYHLVDVAHGSGRPIETDLDKSRACSRLTSSMRRMKRLSDATDGALAMDTGFEIESITLSPDRKLATVEATSTMRLGDMTLARTKGIERLIRRNGRILSVGGETRSWVYSPE